MCVFVFCVCVFKECVLTHIQTDILPHISFYSRFAVYKKLSAIANFCLLLCVCVRLGTDCRDLHLAMFRLVRQCTLICMYRIVNVVFCLWLFLDFRAQWLLEQVFSISTCENDV